MSSENFFQSLKHLYGEEIYKKVNRYEKVKIKKISRLCDLTYLKRCRDNNIIPSCAKIKNYIQTRLAKRIFNRASFALLRERIQHTRKEIDRLDKECLYLHLYLSFVLIPKNWNTLDYIISQRIMKHQQKLSISQKSKFDILINKHKSNVTTTSLPQNKLVYNLSTHILSDTACSILCKGFGFGLTPNHLPTEDIITNVETAIQSLSAHDSQEIRHETVRILKKATLTKKNVSKKELLSLKELKNNNNIVILPADKGKATVVMNKDDYIRKAYDLLDDPAYVKVQCNPLGSSKCQTTKLLKNSSLPKDILKKLIPQDPVISKFYGLPKIHKIDVPLRPIVNSINSTTYELAKYLDSLLKPLIGLSSSYVKNSKHFVELINDLTLTDNDLLVSFDVTSLFTKVPIFDTLKLLEEHFSSDVIKLFKHCLTSCFFIFNGNFYKQVDGVSMGSPISPSIANFFMEHFEKDALNTAIKKPKIWLRYVDDIFTIWPHGKDDLNLFLNHLNTRNNNIKFSIEIEENNCLPFLDVLLEKQDNGKLISSIYRKPTHTNQYLHEKSYHHPAHKFSTIKTLYRRASDLCHPSKLQEELNFLEDVFLKNGYNKAQIKKALTIKTKRSSAPQTSKKNKLFISLPYIANVTDKIGRVLHKYGIQTAYKSSLKIKHLLGNVKDQIPLQFPGIYEIPCECGKVYIGQTGRTVATRLKEHQRHIRLNHPDLSAIAEHAIQELHGIEFINTKLLVKENHWLKRLIREAIEIKKSKDNLNLNTGFDLNKSWLPLIMK